MNKIESLINTKKRNMTTEESKLFISLYMMEENKNEKINDIKGKFLYHILSKRLKYYQIPVSPYLITFICCIIDSPGKAVMWAYTLAEMYSDQQKEIDFNRFSFSEFGMGIPIEEEYKRIWDNQKIGGKNALDMNEYWQFEGGNK
jgi:hypothetical protein